MIYGFDTDDRDAAIAAYLVYVTWRSRDTRRLRITPEIWAQVERFAKSAAKRATTLPEFLERLKPRLMCGTLSPRWLAVGITGDIPMVVFEDGARAQIAPDEGQREFATTVIAGADARAVLRRISAETSYVILLVRDRLERERPIEKRYAAAFAADPEEGQWT